MKLTKQTVYLTVNIEGASGNHIPDKSVLVIKEQGEMDKYWDALVKPREGYFFTPEQLNEYTANVITTTLETAADKAELLSTPYSDWCTECSRSTDLFVSSDSITDTFEEIFKKFKV